MEKRTPSKNVCMNENRIENILKVQRSILLESNRKLNFLIRLHDVRREIENGYPFEKLKEIFDRDLVLNLSYLFDSGGKFSFEKLYCVSFNRKIYDPSQNDIESKLSSLICKIKDSSTVDEIKLVRDKYIAHKDITNLSKSINHNDLKNLINDSFEIHHLFYEEEILDVEKISFHETLFNSIIDNTLELQRIEKEKISKMI